jgi:hypothetical protein
MYGTVCRFQVKPGMKGAIEALEGEHAGVGIIGLRSEYVFQMDRNSDEYYLVVIFDSEEAYKRNAGSPDQDARYRKFRDMLVADPEWNDGTIVHANMRENAH